MEARQSLNTRVASAPELEALTVHAGWLDPRVIPASRAASKSETTAAPLDVDDAVAVDFFMDLRDNEWDPPADLGRYLDLLRSRAMLIFGADIDVGFAGESVIRRCRRALRSLMLRGWVRIASGRELVCLGPGLQRAEGAQRAGNHA
jgi:hypothetical protein